VILTQHEKILVDRPGQTQVLGASKFSLYFPGAIGFLSLLFSAISKHLIGF